jgi:hypothetical protein
MNAYLRLQSPDGTSLIIPCVPIDGHKMFSQVFDARATTADQQLDDYIIWQAVGHTGHVFSTCANISPIATTAALADGRTTIGRSTKYTVPRKTSYPLLIVAG